MDDLSFGEGGHQKSFNEEVAKQFFRVGSIRMPVVSDEEARSADFDQDGLTNEEEIKRVGSDPLRADTDGDGLPDGWEDVHQLNPLDDGTMDPLRGPNAAFGGLAEGSPGADGSGPTVANAPPFSNLMAFSLGVQAFASATPDDLDGDGISNEQDAHPRSRMVAWRKRDWPTQFAFLELEGWDRSTHGYVRSLNNRGLVLADKAVFLGGAWVELPGIRSSYDGPPPPMSYEFAVDGRLHPAGLLSLPRASGLSDGGMVIGNGRVAVLPLSVQDPVIGEVTLYNPGAQPEFAFVWRFPTLEPEIVGRSDSVPIEGVWHREIAAIARDGSTVLIQKQFQEGIPFSNDYLMTLTGPAGEVRISDVLSSPSVPQVVEAGAAVAFQTFSYPPLTYRNWAWMPGESLPRTLWSGWQVLGDAPPENQIPQVIGRLPGGGVCLSVGGRSFARDTGRWHELHGMEGAKFVSPAGSIVVDRPTGGAAILNGGEEVSLVTLTGGEEGEGAEFVVEDLNDKGVALARLIAPGQAERVGLLIPAEMVPDYNRDGQIDDEDRGKVHPGNPWRWWVNDDDDYVRAEGGDVMPSPPMEWISMSMG